MNLLMTCHSSIQERQYTMHRKALDELFRRQQAALHMLAEEYFGKEGPAIQARPRESSVSQVTRLSTCTSATRDVVKKMRTGYQNAMSNLDSPSLTQRTLTLLNIPISSESMFQSLRKRRLHCDRLASFVNSCHFQFLVCTVILLNSIFIGVASTSSMQCATAKFDVTEGGTSVLCSQEKWLSVVDYLFTAIFSLELLCRITAHEWLFLIGRDWMWNVLDLFLVGLAFCGFGLEAFNMDLKMVRLLRLMRMLRTFRLIRLLGCSSFFRNLRLMLLAVIESSVPLLWAFLILSFLIFMFAVIFQEAVASYIVRARSDDQFVSHMQLFFSSMPMTMLTLFMAISGGVSWWEVCQLLLEVHTGYCCLFVLYISVMFLAVLNVITGTFVNEAVEVAHKDRDLRSQSEAARQKTSLRQLQQLFAEIDKNDTGCIRLVEFEESLLREDVRAMLSNLDLDVSDAAMFFKLLDVEGTQRLDIEEFVMGCMRIKGMAKVVDVETLMYENRRFHKRFMRRQHHVAERMETLEREVSTIGGSVRTVESIMKEKSRGVPDLSFPCRL